jgi:hypothetical protein
VILLNLYEIVLVLKIKISLLREKGKAVVVVGVV